MKKISILAVIAVSAAYYALLPFVVANAGGNPIAQAPTALETDVLHLRVTAYSSEPNETDDTPFITADGSHVADGIAASNLLPFGTKIQTCVGNILQGITRVKPPQPEL